MILMTSTSTFSLSSFLDKQDLNNLPQEMLKATIDPLYGATLSGGWNPIYSVELIFLAPRKIEL